LKLFKRTIEKAVNQEIERRLSEIPNNRPPSGYNPIEHIRGGLFHWVLVPFNNQGVWCQLRCLNATELEACGSVTLISLSKDTTRPAMEKLIAMRNIQEELCKQAMNNPTFDEVVKLVEKDDNVYSRTKKQLDEIEKIDISGLTTVQKKEIEERILRLRYKTAYILPEDAFGFITSWALGGDVSDIKKITRDQLLTAAILAERNKNSPSDNIKGFFTDRDKADIDKTSWTVYNEYTEMQRVEKSSKGISWVGGGK